MCFSFGYDRNDYMSTWKYKGVNYRNIILKRDSKIPIIYKTSTDTIIKGLWVCPYNGDTIKLSKNVDIDHIVPLSEADKSGGNMWSSEMKHLFAIDTFNLISTSKKENRSKGDQDVVYWLPKNNKKLYITKWIKVKNKWKLKYDKVELDSIQSYRKQFKIKVKPVLYK